MAKPSSPQQLRLREHQLFLALDHRRRRDRRAVGGAVHRGHRLGPRGCSSGSTRRWSGCFSCPSLVSLVTGFLLAKVFPDVRGSGVPQTEAAFHLHGGVIPCARADRQVHHRRVVYRIGPFDGPGGAVGPDRRRARVGDRALAAAVARARSRDLVPVGAAGALAAAFNTPVAAVIFALEEIIGDMNAPLLGSTVVASVASVVVERSILGNEPLFHVPEYHLVHPAELLAYAALGIVGGIVSLVFCKGLLSMRARLPQSADRARASCSRRSAGWSSAQCCIVAPQVMGVGYEYVDQALNGGLRVADACCCCAALKLVATIVSYASGNAGGIFAPSLYIGAMAGGAVGTIVHRFAPLPTAEPGRLRAGRHGDAVRRHHPGADDVGVHDLRDHAGLSDSGAADGGQPAQFRHLAALSADAGLSRAAASGSRSTCRRRSRAACRRRGRRPT